MTLLLRRFALLLMLAGFASMARADQADIAASSRGVVRVALVSTDGTDSYFVGHGSGVVVAPDKILTAAHVVELARSEKNIVIGIIPAEGKKSYGGRIIAYSPGNDLALIQMDKGSSLPVSTFFAGAVPDGMHVTAIGYPGNVDRAQGLSLEQMITPISPVKSSGNVSGGRSTGTLDTILHTAPMGRGNSGGPLVDDCGRILGINSFGSQSEGGDAEFGFAVSDREIAGFLRQAGVEFHRNNTECLSMQAFIDTLNRTSADKNAADGAKSQADAARSAAAMQQARERAEQDIVSERENRMAFAAVLLAIAVLALGAGGLFFTQDKKPRAAWTGGAGGLILIGAVLVFMTRPGFGDIEDRIKAPAPGAVTKDIAGYDATGANLCRIDEAMSRVTVSETDDVPIDWRADGCVNTRTQYARDGKQWTRMLVPNGEPAISVATFDPATGAYRTERYYLDGDTMAKAREARGDLDIKGCTADLDKVAALETMQTRVRGMLPQYPNERLVYQCMKAPPETIAAP